MGKSAIILGATGLTGQLVLQQLMEDSRYDKVILFSRSSVNAKDDKVVEYLVDLMKPEDYKADFTADEVFCCIGTTAAKTPDKNLYKKIDYGIPVTAAKLAKANGVKTFMVISAMGANVESRVFYNRTKGEMERDVLQQGNDRTYILRPSLIGGDRNEKRLGEYIGKQLFKLLNPLMLGSLKKYRSIHPEKISRAMVWLANNDNDKQIIESDEIHEIAGK